MSQTNKMLIDASHPEETRVVVLRNGRVEEFDYESAARKLLRGNIYLAKVTRVEPALQAAFVDYGGNRHGFLAFNEIHPDYYQIPIADRQALLDEEAAIEAEEEAEADARAERMAKRRGKSRRPGRGRRGEDNAEGGVDDNSDDTVLDADADGDDFEETGGASADADDDALEMDATASNDDDMREEADSNDDAGGSDPDDGAPPRTIAQSVGRDPSLSASPDNLDAVTEHNVAEPLAGAPDETSLFMDETAAVETGEMAVDTSGDADFGEATDTIATSEAEPVSEQQTGDGGDDTELRDRKVDDDSDDDDDDAARDTDDEADADNGDGDDAPEVVDTEEDALEEVAVRPRRTRRSYKIQEVIKRRQVLLIQVVKEERGNKGAALTTYLSLAGRYTVLMPNTARGGGISRKITQPQDRKRLKAIANELEVPEGMGLIIRTAGAARTKQEIRRDFEYLLRLWESVRELTLESTAPSLVYEEGNLIKRSIRDLYNKDVDEVVVSGDHAYRDAKDFMRMLMPSHAKNVIPYKEPEPLFTRYQIERQLNAMFSPQVTLKSGGYLVINQTEALVAVDVNSGRSTREFSIEETALHTNLEAADELARQLKLRDLAGLIVVDFIDMEEKRNNRHVERRLKEALRHDRARIQIGRISHFGLLEMSRQRMRTGVLEGSTTQCVHCQGTGIIRSTESIALAVLRGLEDAVMGRQRGPLVATTTATVALYILNNKRDFIVDMENRYGYPITVEASDKMVGANYAIERQTGGAPLPPVRRNDRTAVNMDWGFEDETAGEAADDTASVSADAGEPRARDDEQDGRSEEGGRKRRRRRRRGGRRNGESAGDDIARFDDEADAGEQALEADASDDDSDDGMSVRSAAGDEDGGDDSRGRGRRGRRRGRRGGRRNRERMAQQRDAGDGSQDDAEFASAIPGLGPQPSISGSIIEISSPGAAYEDRDAGPVTAPGEAEGAAHGADADEGDADAGERAPRRRRTASSRRAPEDQVAEDQVAEDQAVEAHAEYEEHPAPGAEIAATSPDAASGGHGELRQDDAPTEAGAADAMADETAEAQQADRSPRTEPVLDTPRIERVSVGSDAGGEEDAPAPKRGWWQRRLLGE